MIHLFLPVAESVSENKSCHDKFGKKRIVSQKVSQIKQFRLFDTRLYSDVTKCCKRRNAVANNAAVLPQLNSEWLEPF